MITFNFIEGEPEESREAKLQQISAVVAADATPECRARTFTDGHCFTITPGDEIQVEYVRNDSRIGFVWGEESSWFVAMTNGYSASGYLDERLNMNELRQAVNAFTAQPEPVSGEASTPPSVIDALFTAGVNQCMSDEEAGSKRECYYPADTLARHWWTRGYAHQARAFRAVELEALRAAAAQSWAEASNRALAAEAQLEGAELAVRDARDWNVTFKKQLAEADKRNERLKQQLGQSLEFTELANTRITELEARLAAANDMAEAYHLELQDAAVRTARIAELEARLQNASVLNDEISGRLGDLLEAYEEVVEGNRALSARLKEANAALDNKVEIAPARLKALAEKLWPTVNARRCDLIKREASGEASQRDLAELAELQSLADEYINIFAPLPIKQLEAYMESKGIEIPATPESAGEMLVNLSLAEIEAVEQILWSDTEEMEEDNETRILLRAVIKKLHKILAYQPAALNEQEGKE